MPRKQELAPPISSVRFDFVRSMDALCNESMMLMQFLETLIQHEAIKPELMPMARERAAAFRARLISDT